MAATWRIGFTDIPAKVLINNILPLCEVKDVLSFGCTNNFFALIASDEAFWKRKLAVDYNFTGSETTRTSDRKFIYQRLRNPRVFVWGCVTFSFYYSTRRSFVCRCIHACLPIATIQRRGHGPAWAATVSKHKTLACSFSARTSSSRRPRGQPGNESSVSVEYGTPSLNKHPHILLFLSVDRALHALGADGSVYVWGGYP